MSGAAKRGRGRPAWLPTDEQRRLVEHYTCMGYTQEQTAALLEVTVDTLAKHCRRELDLGALQVNAKIGGKLYQKAMAGDTSALIFWAKTRMGWKETSRQEHTGADGGAIEIEQRMKEDADAVASAIAGLAERARAAGLVSEPKP